MHGDLMLMHLMLFMFFILRVARVRILTGDHQSLLLRSTTTYSGMMAGFTLVIATFMAGLVALTTLDMVVTYVIALLYAMVAIGAILKLRQGEES